MLAPHASTTVTSVRPSEPSRQSPLKPPQSIDGRQGNGHILSYRGPSHSPSPSPLQPLSSPSVSPTPVLETRTPVNNTPPIALASSSAITPIPVSFPWNQSNGRISTDATFGFGWTSEGIYDDINLQSGRHKQRIKPPSLKPEALETPDMANRRASFPKPASHHRHLTDVSDSERQRNGLHDDVGSKTIHASMAHRYQRSDVHQFGKRSGYAVNASGEPIFIPSPSKPLSSHYSPTDIDLQPSSPLASASRPAAFAKVRSDLHQYGIRKDGVAPSSWLPSQRPATSVLERASVLSLSGRGARHAKPNGNPPSPSRQSKRTVNSNPLSEVSLCQSGDGPCQSTLI